MMAEIDPTDIPMLDPDATVTKITKIKFSDNGAAATIEEAWAAEDIIVDESGEFFDGGRRYRQDVKYFVGAR